MFSGYITEKQGRGFGGGTSILYIDSSTLEKKKETKFFIVNEQEKQLISVQDEKQIELLYHCLYGTQVTQEEIDWLINSAKFNYFNNVETYIESNKSESEAMKND